MSSRSTIAARIWAFRSEALGIVNGFSQTLPIITSRAASIRLAIAGRGSAAAAFRYRGYLSPEASLSAMRGVQAAGEGLVCLESPKVLDA
jgi:hypothetical protein